jgi:hypothetical protein
MHQPAAAHVQIHTDSPADFRTFGWLRNSTVVGVFRRPATRLR